MKEYIVGIENEHSHALDVCYKKELIRCKDCKYFFHWAELNIMGCKAFDWRSKPDDFCSFAERKEDA